MMLVFGSLSISGGTCSKTHVVFMVEKPASQSEFELQQPRKKLNFYGLVQDVELLWPPKCVKMVVEFVLLFYHRNLV